MRKLFKRLSKLITSITILAALPSCSQCIVDIYHAPNSDEKYKKSLTSYNRQCHYTITECENDCTTLHIKREHYDRWAKEYTKLGVKPPHPKRSDIDKLQKPNKY